MKYSWKRASWSRFLTVVFLLWPCTAVLLILSVVSGMPDAMDDVVDDWRNGDVWREDEL